jgi:hypothetical protein
MKKRFVTDLDACKALWNAFLEPRNISDRWDFRLCFHNYFHNTPHFLVLEDKKGVFGLVPLAYVPDRDIFVFFPGEDWKGKTWLERTPVYCREPLGLEELLSECPDRSYLRYMEVDESLLPLAADIDEIAYVLAPPKFHFDMNAYCSRFARKRLKSIMKEIASVRGCDYTWRVNHLPDFDRMVHMNRSNFGHHSYFADARFADSFRDVVALLDRKGWLRMVSLEIDGKTAAVDLGAVYRDTYTVFLGGTDPDYRGVAKVMNMHHLEFACARCLEKVDFLCGDFTWKKLWHLDAQPLYRFISPALKEQETSPSPVTEERDPGYPSPVSERAVP